MNRRKITREQLEWLVGSASFWEAVLARDDQTARDIIARLVGSDGEVSSSEMPRDEATENEAPPKGPPTPPEEHEPPPGEGSSLWGEVDDGLAAYVLEMPVPADSELFRRNVVEVFGAEVPGGETQMSDDEGRVVLSVQEYVDEATGGGAVEVRVRVPWDEMLANAVGQLEVVVQGAVRARMPVELVRGRFTGRMKLDRLEPGHDDAYYRLTLKPVATQAR